MADDSTDTAFGFILFILFLALLGYAAGGISSSSSTAGTTGGTSQSLPPLAGSSVSSCTGTLKQDETVEEQHPAQGLGGPHGCRSEVRDSEDDLGGDAESHAGIYRRQDPNGI